MLKDSVSNFMFLNVENLDLKLIKILVIKIYLRIWKI